jgi:hypothetical protein
MALSSQTELLDAKRKMRAVFATLIGICLCVFGFIFTPSLLLAIVMIYFALVVAFVGHSIFVRTRPTRRKSPAMQAPKRPRWRWTRLRLAFGLLALIVAGVVVGVLLGSAKEPRTVTSTAPTGRYRVSGTCLNGACTVNECAEPAPCGLDFRDRIHEGQAIDIVCQTPGDVASAPDGQESRIWDRLSSNLYVSDLFVEGTATGRFTRSVPRCPVL